MTSHPHNLIRYYIREAVSKDVRLLPFRSARALCHAHLGAMHTQYLQSQESLSKRRGFYCSMNASHVHVILMLVSRDKEALETEDQSLFLLDLLPNIHHPLVADYKPQLLSTVAKLVVDDVETFVQSKSGTILEMVTQTVEDAYEQNDQQDFVKAISNILQSLTSVNGFDVVRDQVVRRILSTLGQPSLLSTTVDDVGIFYTPEGELYDTSFLPKPDAEISKNQKGYDDLKWEMEVRKELAKKKGSAMDITPKLSKHHLEMKEKTLQAEAQTRARMRDLDRQANMAFVLLESLLDGNLDKLEPSVPSLVSSLLRVIKMSALAGQRAMHAYVKLSGFLSDHGLGSAAADLGRAAIRLSGSKAAIPTEWETELISEQVLRAFRNLVHITHGLFF